MRLIGRAFLRIYRLFISPLIHLVMGPGYGCRFVPSCGNYMDEAVNEYGLVKGVALGLKRIFRCHPFGDSGYDPIPPDSAKKDCR